MGGSDLLSLTDFWSMRGLDDLAQEAFLSHVYVRVNLGLSRAQQFNECFSETHVAQWVQDRVDSRVQPKEPEGCFIERVPDARPMAGSSDDHEQSVGSPAQAKHTHDDGQ